VEIPEFEARRIIERSKKKPKRRYQIFNCCVDGCGWKGTRPDKHLVSKTHKFEKVTAKKMAKQIRLSQTISDKKPVNGKNMYTAESLSQSFLDWFQSIEGGNFIPESWNESKRRQKSQHNKKIASMVGTVLKTFFGSHPFHCSALESLDAIGRPADKGQKSVVEKLKEGRSWGTVKNYLCAFSHFVDFLEVSKPDLIDKVFLPTIRRNLKGSLQTVTKFTLEELQHRKISDRDKVVSFSDIEKYQQAKVAENLSKSFSTDMTDSDTLRQRVHRISRHIMLELALPNGKRTGIFNCMNCSEVMQAVPEDGGFVVMVAEGKTFKVSGAAGVFCTQKEYSLLIDYVQRLRPLLCPTTDQVFCRLSGERASVSETGEFLESAWEDFGAMIAKDLGGLTFTLIRKTVVSKSRQEGVSAEVKEQMARHMDHSVQTADRYYDVSTGTKLTAMFRKTFNKFHDPFDPDENEDDNDGSVSDEEIVPSRKLDGAEGTHSEHEQGCSLQSVHSQSVLRCSVKIQGSQKRQISSTFGKPDVFSKEDKLRLFRCCANLIEKGRAAGKGITKHQIVNQIKSAGSNFADLLKNYTIAQICNRVRCEIRKKK
jgi:hypothetical protein